MRPRIGIGIFLLLSLPMLALANAQPELPRSTVDTTFPTVVGKSIAVHAGDDFQKALDSAEPGDEVVLDAGAAFTGNFALRDKNGTAPVIIRSSAMPPANTRVSPADASSMAKIVSPGRNEPAISTAPGASGYWLVGLEITKPQGDSVTNLILLGTGSETSLSDEPSRIVLDRDYIHGDAASTLRRCVALNGSYLAVINSYISDCHEAGADSQAVAGWNGPGPFKIENNYLEAAAENALFGGADPKIQNLTPSDIEIRGNSFFKPLSWKSGNPHWTVKNLLELKNAARVLIEGNTFENSWTDGQTGNALLFKSANQDGNCPWCVTEDVTIRNNAIKNAEEGVRINAAEGSPLPVKASRIAFENDSFHNISGKVFQIFNGTSDVTLDHVTTDSGDGILFSDGAPNPGLVVSNSTFARGAYGIGAGSVEGSQYLATWFPGAVFTNNTITNISSSLLSKYPSTTGAGIQSPTVTAPVAQQPVSMPVTPPVSAISSTTSSASTTPSVPSPATVSNGASSPGAPPLAPGAPVAPPLSGEWINNLVNWLQAEKALSPAPPR